ncbi:ATP-binding protein [Nocardia stercoris]|uniref:ATP-binding protein n=1 Tax=Nocardia stercoris TaxID=2483361 RepID=A0A3M2KXD9_9NOCA|nr:ATP-binding protein [Nocardia stercoris]
MSGVAAADPFGTAALRAATIAAWRDSPTRLREDAATEADLVRAGYRDRLLTELAQNAADAATKAGVPGQIRVLLRDRTLSVANVGAALDVPGLHALTALRVSAKPGEGERVGRFGVGFTAVLSAGDEIEFRSTSGSIRFSRAETAQTLADNEIHHTDDPEFRPPALRLPWPTTATPAPGFDSEILITLRDEVDAPALLASMRAEATDLLLELPALQEIRIGDDRFTSTREPIGGGLTRLRVVRPLAETWDAEVESRADETETREWWEFSTAHARWSVPVRDGRPVAARPDVLRAPTRSDEELSLPAVLIADVAMQPDRRRLLPGAPLRRLAAGYADFARALPPLDRLVLVPVPGFARSEADALLREALIEELAGGAWLPIVPVAGDTADLLRDNDFYSGVPAFGAPVAAGSQGPGAGPNTVGEPAVTVSGDPAAGELSAEVSDEPATPVAVPRRASVFTGVTADLAVLLAEMLGPLVVPELSGRSTADRLAALDVHRVGPARIAELSASLQRPPQWWYALYDALEPFAGDPLVAEELGALAVPLADGRLVTGPRTVLCDEALDLLGPETSERTAAFDELPIRWARLVHPEAAHPLLNRLGAQVTSPADLLTDPALRLELEHDPADPDLVAAVLFLASRVAPGTVLPAWLGQLELPGADGEPVPADELLLPDAPLTAVLDGDSPFGTVDSALVDRFGAAALRALGVGWGFTVLTESDPTGPDHDLDDEPDWWSGLAEDPPELVAVRDLDLIDPDAWPAALRLLLDDPVTRPLLAAADGYTAWWLRRHARVGGVALGLCCRPGDPDFAGLLTELPGFTDHDLAALSGVLADRERITPELAAALLDALADPARTPSPDTVARAHRLLAAVIASGHLELDQLDLPSGVRALSGAVIDPADALVLDRPEYGQVLPPGRLVVGDIETAAALATLLDLPSASQAVTAEVLGVGRPAAWRDAPEAVLFGLQGVPHGDLFIHDTVRVRLGGAYTATVTVPWWRDDHGTHLTALPTR